MKKECVQEIADNISSISDITDVVKTILDVYARKTGRSYVGVFYMPCAFDKEGQLKSKKIQPKVAGTIVESIKRRAELALEYRMDVEKELMKNGFVVCA